MKRIIALIAALLLLLTLGSGCGGKKDAEGQTEPAGVSEDEALFAPLIEKYREAFSNFSYDSYDLDINYLLVDYYYDGGRDLVGYTVYDIDRDGTPELMIGEKDEQNPEQMRLNGLAGIYTLQNGVPKWLIGSDYEFAGISVLAEGKILENRTYWGKQIESASVNIVYGIKAGELSAEKTYFGVGEYDETGSLDKVTLSYSVDGALPTDSDGEVLLEEMQPISAETYKAAMASFDGAALELPITLFFE